MKKIPAVAAALLLPLVLAVSAAGAKPISGSISGPNEAGPYHYGDSVSFSVESNLKNNPYPMVAVACYQDADGDGQITFAPFIKDADGNDVANPDFVWLQLDRPDAAFNVGGGESQLDAAEPASCVATLYAYSWKGGQESIVELDSVGFPVGP